MVDIYRHGHVEYIYGQPKKVQISYEVVAVVALRKSVRKWPAWIA